MYKNFVITLSLLFLLQNMSYATQDGLRTQFLENKTRICGINLRTFNAKDLNGNEIIDEDEESGNFLNAIERLDEIKELGINTLHVLPITPVGKLKALGTAGSLYAIASFDEINEQLADKNSDLTAKEQAQKFIAECHKRGIKVIIDLPSCGSYDLFLKHPELFIKDNKNISIVPTDWTDVRLLNTGTNTKLNQDVINAHKKFIDLVLELEADGLRADVATIKPYKFWEEIIKYARNKNSEFLFLAEASDSWREPPSEYAEFTPYDKLLQAGFDGYYGSFFDLKDWNAVEFIEHIKYNLNLLKSYKEPKSVILSFTTHDEVSPVILYGENFSVMIAWLEATLPFNPYSIDGFAYGDKYIYPWANSKAEKTETDDDYYFVHRGKLDIFNFSRIPKGGKYGINTNILDNFKQAYDFRISNENLITQGSFIPIKTFNDKIFAFQRNYHKTSIIVMGNLDFQNNIDITIKDSKFNKKLKFDIIHGDNDIKINRKKLSTGLKAGEIKVIKFAKE